MSDDGVRLLCIEAEADALAAPRGPAADYSADRLLIGNHPVTVCGCPRCKLVISWLLDTQAASSCLADLLADAASSCSLLQPRSARRTTTHNMHAYAEMLPTPEVLCSKTRLSTASQPQAARAHSKRTAAAQQRQCLAHSSNQPMDGVWREKTSVWVNRHQARCLK